MIHRGTRVSITDPPGVDWVLDGDEPMIVLDMSKNLAVLPLLARAVAARQELHEAWELLVRDGLGNPHALSLLLADSHVRDALSLTFTAWSADDLVAELEEVIGAATEEARFQTELSRGERLAADRAMERADKLEADSRRYEP